MNWNFFHFLLLKISKKKIMIIFSFQLLFWQNFTNKKKATNKMYMNDELDSNVYIVSLSPILQVFKHVILIFQIQEPLNEVGNQVPTPCGQ
jgi:glutamate synthase domain-containing protein 1